MSKDTGLQQTAEILYDYVENKTTYQTDKIVTIASDAYLDGDRWEKELESIFMRLPLAMASTAELREPNSYKAMEAVGLPILITRGSDGKPRAFLNVCAHRSARVADEGCGIKKRFSCEYHGWTYNNEGKLVGVAEGETFGKIDKSQRGLKELPCEEKGGLIFVILTPDVPMNLDAFMDGMLDDLDNIGFKDWAYLGKREVTGANWKIAFDGYLEGYHFSSLHPETIHPRSFSNMAHYEAFGPHLRIGFPQTGLKDAFDAAPKEKWGEMENNGYDFVRILFPNLSIFLAPEITQVAQLFPGPTPDKNRTVLNFFRKEPAKDEQEKQALEDPYFAEKKLFPNVDFYSGIILEAMGFPTSMFTPIFALSRTIGWISQWKEQLEDPQLKIGRPRQLYQGATAHDYVDVENR